METREIVEREYKAAKEGQSFYIITCPFCGRKIHAQVRGCGSRGRRCECKALFKGNLAAVSHKRK